MGTHKYRLGAILLMLMLGLTACFKDAANSNPNPTVVNVNDLLPTATNTRTRTPPPSFTPGADVQASKTLIVGGPPVEGEGDEISETADALPTFTEVPPGEATVPPPGFGDTGVSPTASRTATTLPGTLQPTPTPVEEELDECLYYVQSGDTLFSIALEYDMFPEDFYPDNPELAVNPNSLDIGQAIRIPGCVSDNDGIVETPDPSGTIEGPTEEGATPATQTSGTAVPSGAQTYTVQAGDNLFRISLQFGVTVQDIVNANDFLITENTIIKEGDVLIIPAPSE